MRWLAPASAALAAQSATTAVGPTPTMSAAAVARGSGWARLALPDSESAGNTRSRPGFAQANTVAVLFNPWRSCPCNHCRCGQPGRGVKVCVCVCVCQRARACVRACARARSSSWGSRSP